MKKLVLSLLSAVAVVATAHAADTVLIQDDFTSGGGKYDGNANNPASANRSPDTADVPGNTYIMPAENDDEGINTSVNYAYMRGDDAAAVSVLGGPVTSLPSVLNISALLYSTTTGMYAVTAGSTAEQADRGVGLGFFSSTSESHALDDFTGILINLDNELTLYNNGTNTGTDVNVGSTGGTLSYDYDTTTGAITDVIFNSVDYSSTFAGHDVATGLSLAGWAVSSDNGNGTGIMQNVGSTPFVVSSVTIPEPTTEALFALGGCLVLAGWLRLRRSKA